MGRRLCAVTDGGGFIRSQSAAFDPLDEPAWRLCGRPSGLSLRARAYPMITLPFFIDNAKMSQ